MKYLVNYNVNCGIPDASEFVKYSLADLEDTEFAENFQDPADDEIENWTEWGRAGFDLDQQGYCKAIEAAKAGKTILVAQDDDGYYFAIANHGEK